MEIKEYGTFGNSAFPACKECGTTTGKICRGQCNDTCNSCCESCKCPECNRVSHAVMVLGKPRCEDCRVNPGWHLHRTEDEISAMQTKE